MKKTLTGGLAIAIVLTALFFLVMRVIRTW